MYGSETVDGATERDIKTFQNAVCLKTISKMLIFLLKGASDAYKEKAFLGKLFYTLQHYLLFIISYAH